MSELSSSKKIPANSSNNPNSISINKRNNTVNNSKLTAQTGLQDKTVKNLPYEDKFNSMKMDANTQPEGIQRNSFLKKSGETSRNIQNTLSKLPILPSGEMFKSSFVKIYMNMQQKIFNPLNQIQINTQQKINTFMSRYVDIMDKISAVFGEKEKDIRERLSDTFKRVKLKIYELFEKVDTSMEQKDHQKEKKTKDPKKQNSDKNSKSHRVDNFAA